MDIKCKTNPYYFITSSQIETIHFQGVKNTSRVLERVSTHLSAKVKRSFNVDLCEDIMTKGPVARKSATGLLSYINKIKTKSLNYIQNYKKNIQHTFDHKIIFALIERELFGKNSIDSITHDLDKLILYILGCPKSFVSNFHRKNSVHHTESGKKNNLRSMLCDNIASSPEFKPEKKKSLRDYYNSCKELQSVKGFYALLEKYNYGENLDFNAIKAEKDIKFNPYNGIMTFIVNTLVFIYSNAKTSRL